MKIFFLSLLILLHFSCEEVSSSKIKEINNSDTVQNIVSSQKFNKNSWQYFLQHLPTKKGIVVDYRGYPVLNQLKQDGIIQYDVGKTDLQQCADALIRIRSEYLFSQKRYTEIGFHFVDGHYFSYDNYCKGARIIMHGKSLSFLFLNSCLKTHETLRSYLNDVYSYASTISLAKELKEASDFEVGIVVIFPGSPGHCFIISDEGRDRQGEKVFKLVEGYSPAQSIYVLRNIEDPSISPWYHLTKGIIRTASCEFKTYKLGTFE